MTLRPRTGRVSGLHESSGCTATAAGASAGIAIFVKTPGLSTVKSRLAESIGETAAVEWYRHAAAAVASVASAAGDATGAAVYWAVAELAGRDVWRDLPTRWQGDGGLGERMARVHADLVQDHGAALLIGADAPQITVDDLESALAWLDCQAPRCVLGPARDGGFWLFGANRVVPASAWTQVRYSTATTARDFERVLGEHGGQGEWKYLRMLDDVDRGEDLEPARCALKALAAPTTAQSTLLRRMHEAPVIEA